MPDDGLLVLTGDDVGELLAGRELEIVEAVSRAYVAHGRGLSSLPQSTFLRFPGDSTNRIIALPAFLGDGFATAGMKWIASFPGNLRRGMARASAVLVLNSCDDGRPEALLEGSLISARRTAASAAVAARSLLAGAAPRRVGLIGAGVIARETARFLTAVLPGVERFLIFDLDGGRAARLAARLAADPGVAAEVAPSAAAVLAGCPLVLFATTALAPHVDDLSPCAPGTTILHVSLRDLAPAAVLACDNVVDDVDHVCRAETSVHLAARATGGREFIRCTLADILEGRAAPRRDRDTISVFSPFGLGVLDLAVGKLALDLALAAGRGTVVPSFLPTGAEA